MEPIVRVEVGASDEPLWEEGHPVPIQFTHAQRDLQEMPATEKKQGIKPQLGTAQHPGWQPPFFKGGIDAVFATEKLSEAGLRVLVELLWWGKSNQSMKTQSCLGEAALPFLVDYSQLNRIRGYLRLF